MNQKLLLILITLIVVGCSSTYTQLVLQAPSSKLNSNLGVLISTPEDGWYGNKTYRNSGRMTANAVMSAFSKYTKRADVVDDCEGDQCMENIDAARYGYYIQPKILHWEDRNTEWSGKPDRIEIQITIYDAITKEEVAKSTYTGKSQWATLGGDHPQDLLPEPTLKYVDSLYN